MFWLHVICFSCHLPWSRRAREAQWTSHTVPRDHLASPLLTDIDMPLSGWALDLTEIGQEHRLFPLGAQSISHDLRFQLSIQSSKTWPPGKQIIGKLFLQSSCTVLCIFWVLFLLVYSLFLFFKKCKKLFFPRRPHYKQNLAEFYKQICPVLTSCHNETHEKGLVEEGDQGVVFFGTLEYSDCLRPQCTGIHSGQIVLIFRRGGQGLNYFNRVAVQPVVSVCFCWLGFLFPNCSADSQKPSGNYSQFTLNSSLFKRKGVINGLGLFHTMAFNHPTTPLCPTPRACQRSQGSAVDRHWSLTVLQIQGSGSNSNRLLGILSAMDSQLVFPYPDKFKRPQETKRIFILLQSIWFS